MLKSCLQCMLSINYHTISVYITPIITQLPWSECEDQFQIIYKLGFGKTPPVPETALSDEGHDFLSNCLIIDPQVRCKAIQLLDHPFVKVRILLHTVWCVHAVKPLNRGLIGGNIFSCLSFLERIIDCTRFEGLK